MAAAAYAALLSLFNNLELIQTHTRHSFSFDHKQIQSLLQIVCFLIDFMEAGDYHGGSKRAAGDLEMRIASAAHATEDVIESHVVDQIHAGSTLDGKKRSRFMLDVQKVTENMEFVRRKAIKVQKAQITGFKSDRPTLSAATSSTPDLTSSEKDKMVGFDDVLSQLLDLLTGNLSSRQIIPIVGTGGIGKTTLAKNAFQHAITVEHFHICLWVTISQQYVLSDILLKLLSRDENPISKSVSELGKELHQSLYGRRYLVVLDDMWSEEPWNMIKRFFPDTSCGSRIIVTSRQPLSLGSSSLAMSFMKKDASWDLFCQKVFAKQSCPLVLEEAGKKIVEKCKGLPLAIVVVAGHLQMSPRTQEYWENVTNHMKSILDSRENGGELFDILYLSYGYLPIHLKPCFLYMGVFPEDYVISASDLIQLWIGEGFLKPNKEQTLEEIGEDHLNDLINRNLILVDKMSLIRKVETCKIHDVLRELGLKIAEKEKLFCVFDTSRSVERERRIVVNPDEMPHALRLGNIVRSQIAWEYKFPMPFNSKLLRVVALKYGDMADEIENILRRVNLRFIRGRFELNSSISLLWNLQTLIVQGRALKSAPYEIWEMSQLRHLEGPDVFLPNPLPSDVVLPNLQTLKNVVNLRLSDEVCERIPNVKELRMRYSNFEGEYHDEAWSYCPHNLGRLNRLETLHCSIYSTGREWHEFALALTFPSSLKELELTSVQLDWDEITMKIGSLPLLEVLKLLFIEGGAEWNPVEGGFPCLRYLEINTCDDLKNWNVERWHFPVLEELHLYGVRELGELTCGIGEIPTLEHIHLRKCSVSLGISAMRIVVEQEDNGNDNLRLHLQFQYEKEVERFNKIAQEEGLTTNISLSFESPEISNIFKLLKFFF